MSEFAIIEKYFAQPFARDEHVNQPHTQSNCTQQSDGVILGIGDDAAIISAQGMSGNEWVVCVDTLVEGVHFLPSCAPEDVAYKALAVNLSDFAAMGAEPKWMTLALTLPEANHPWLARFSSSLRETAHQYGVTLVGGDTTRGPLTVSIQLMGTKSSISSGMPRTAAKPGQLIGVSGVLGGAALGLGIATGRIDVDDPEALLKLNRPEPRIALGQRIAPYASACIDISDGLGGDLMQLCQSSNVTAHIESDQIPIYQGLLHPYGNALDDCSSAVDDSGWDLALSQAVSFGDDYELLFTIDPEQWVRLQSELPVSERQTEIKTTPLNANENSGDFASNRAWSDPEVRIIGTVGPALDKSGIGKQKDTAYLSHHALIFWSKAGKPYRLMNREQQGYEHFKESK